MKKLMIAAAIVCAAVVSQAAQYNWVGEEQIFAGYTGGSGEGVSGIAYLINATTGLSYADAVKSLEGKDTASIIAKAYATPSGTATAVEEGTFDGYTLDTITITAGDSLYALILDEGGEWAYLTTAVESPEAEAFGTTALTFDSEATRSAAGTGWYAVPEPTSGLLLLIGMAGLALRRRRA